MIYSIFHREKIHGSKKPLNAILNESKRLAWFTNRSDALGFEDNIRFYYYNGIIALFSELLVTLTGFIWLNSGLPIGPLVHLLCLRPKVEGHILYGLSTVVCSSTHFLTKNEILNPCSEGDNNPDV